MKTVVKLAGANDSKRINVSQFEKKAQQILEKDVRVHFLKAKAAKSPSNAVKCNNPV